MKKRFLSHIFLSCMVSVFAFTANATIYFDDNFDAYNDGALYNQGGWVKYGTDNLNPIQLTATNLTYDGYQSGTTGKAVQLQSSTTDIWRRFAESIDNSFQSCGFGFQDLLYEFFGKCAGYWNCCFHYIV